MKRIISGEKNYEFRRYLLPNSVKRVWFFTKSPVYRITHVCEIESAIHRPVRYSTIPTPRNNPFPLPLDGYGNLDFNEGELPSMAGVDFAYFIKSVYRLNNSITVSELKRRYMLPGVPKGPVFVPERVLEDVDWKQGEKILERAARKRGWETAASVVGATSGWIWRGGQTTLYSSDEDSDDSMDVDESIRGTKRYLRDGLDVSDHWEAIPDEHTSKRLVCAPRLSTCLYFTFSCSASKLYVSL
jgi:hypothetical protein